MKTVLALLVVLSISAGALYFAQRRPRHDTVSPNAIVDVAADWQRDVTRAPLHFTRLSDAEEVQIGDRLAQQYSSALPMPTPESKALEHYVNEVGLRVAANARRKLPYHFHLIADPNLINAFALPGGHVFIGRGLLDQITSEDELAFVLGHEIEHIDHYHAVERIQVEAQLKHLDLEIVAAIAEVPMSLWQAGYSKDEEFEADREGLRLFVSSGYSAQGAIKILERFAKLDREYVIHAETPQDELSEVAIECLAGYFRSHPLTSERLTQAQHIIAQDQFPLDRPLKPFHVEYEVTAGSR